MGRRIQPADLRIVAVNRQLGFESFDHVQAAASQIDRAGRDGRQANLEIRAHRRAMSPDQVGTADVTRQIRVGTQSEGPYCGGDVKDRGDSRRYGGLSRNDSQFPGAGRKNHTGGRWPVPGPAGR